MLNNERIVTTHHEASEEHKVKKWFLIKFKTITWSKPIMKWIKFFYPVKSISTEKASEIMASDLKNDHILLDVREPVEYAEGHIDGSVLIPLMQTGKRADELDRDKTILVYCRSGSRSSLAARILAAKGFRSVYNIAGGILQWNV